jgi:hypothetical protein
MIMMTSASALADGGGNSHAIYDSIPSPLPANLSSVGAEAYAFNEFGNAVTFSLGSPRDLSTVVVTMSSWGCSTGHWNTFDCATTKGATFSLPITFNIYNPSGATPGTLIASVTQTFAIPYRPSASAKCTGPDLGKWYNASDKTCYNGLATNITFDFSSKHITLPSGVVYGIVYNTTSYGPAPFGPLTTCYASSGGCGYDSLNIALSNEPTDVSVGSDPNPGTVFQNSSIGSEYCDLGSAGTGFFRLDSPTSACWSPYIPAVQFNVKQSTGGNNGGGHGGGHGGHGDGHPGHGGGHH